MATEDFELPDVGEGVAEGELVSWLVAPGDHVTEDQPVAEVETDKALVEVPSPYDGVVTELHVAEGEMVPVGDVIITYELDGDDGASDEAAAADDGAATGEPAADDGASGEAAGDDGEAAASVTDNGATVDGEVSVPEGRVFAPPGVRQLARELGVDLAAVDGAGPGGRITEADVRAAAGESTPGDGGPATTVSDDAPAPRNVGGGESAVSQRGNGAGAEAADREQTLAVPATRRVAEEESVDIDAVPTDRTRDGESFVTEQQVREYAQAQRQARAAEVEADAGEATAAVESDRPADTASAEAGEETRPYRGIRQTIGEQMAESKYTAPHVTHHDTVTVPGLVDVRERLKGQVADDVSLTYMPFVMKAIVAALEEFPILNSQLREDDEEIVLKDEYNVGIAVATDAGLMVPVVENVDEKGVEQLAREVADLAERARDRDISPAEMQGGTFTITNFGAIGGEYATPIINYPETAILGLGAIERRPVVDGEAVVAEHTLPLSLSIDHRVIDGAEAAQFTNRVMEYLENPELLLL